MLSILGSLLTWFLGLFGSSTRKDEIALGRAQQQVADNKADLSVIAKANRAAQSEAERKVQSDDNDLDKGL
jgi:membrane protein YqaA with SNARE-associated domain